MAKDTNDKSVPSLHLDAKFENPYNFVPAFPRDIDHCTLGDAEPSGHHRYHADNWSGRISVELTTVTPLLIPDQSAEDSNGHKSFGIRTDDAGAPYLPPTSLKGALRAAYEAVTNSRMGVWSKSHDLRLAFRLPADSALGLIPVRIENVIDNGKKRLAAVEHEAVPLRFYSKTEKDRKRGTEKFAERYRNIEEGDTIPIHGDRVQWHATSGNLCWVDETDPVAEGWRRGYAIINGPNIKDKTKERLFLEVNDPRKFCIKKDIKKQWEELILDYQRLHELELKKRRDEGNAPEDFLGEKPGETAWSRHIHDVESSKLKHGLLCYAKVSKGELMALYPVMISRDLYAESPSRLLDESLKPALDLGRLSPADRVVGWVKDGRRGQFKGQLRIGAVHCVQGAEAVERVGEGDQGLPLAILGAPKPAQARFYAARDAQGYPFPDHTIEKAAMYREGQGLRGRKVYVHQRQAVPKGYWDPKTSEARVVREKISNSTVFREWQRLADKPEKIRTDQNRSITAWVKPGSTFRFDVDVINLSSVELGALLWLLNLDDKCHFRIGGGKPLGFGSARLNITGLDLRDGEAIRADYASFGEAASGGKRIRSEGEIEPLIEDYQAALPAAVGAPDVEFSKLRIVKAFLNAARGGTLPVHYPRTQEAPSPAGENFKWFVANEKSDKKQRQERYSLPDLAGDERGLWILKE